MILQIHEGHEAYFRICYLNCPRGPGLQAYTGYSENLIDCIYIFSDM
jgi:hypothetical protein